MELVKINIFAAEKYYAFEKMTKNAIIFLPFFGKLWYNMHK